MEEKNKSVHITTLGCKVNAYESEAMLELFKEAGYEVHLDPEDFSDVYIINTCTVTNLSDRKSRQIIRRGKKINPQAVVCVVGCYAQVSPEEVEKIPGVDLILGTKDRDKILDYVDQAMEKEGPLVHVEDARSHRDFEDFSIDQQTDHTRAYVKIQDGCNQFCSYCVIPYARGPIRSRSLEDSHRQVEKLVEAGYKEVVLTGIHVASYGKDLGDLRLADLIEDLAQIQGLERIRLSSVDPNIVTEDFIQRLAATGKVCDHFHLSLQHGSNKILQAMNRKYRAEDFLEKTEIIRHYMPYAGLSTDCIVGFPGEEEEDFEEMCVFVKKVGFSRLHVFKYSPRQGTPAAKKKQINGKIKNTRSQKLIAIGDVLAQDFIEKNKGRDLDVLFEQENQGFYEGYTSNYIRVKTKSDRPLTNQILHGTIEKSTGEPVEFKLRRP